MPKDDGNNILLEMKGITKCFPGLKALDNVNLTLHKGEVLGLMGENGAGKSTICKVISGFHSADEGEMYIEGKKCTFKNSIESKRHGITMIYQELSLVKDLSVAENIYLGNLPKNKLGILDSGELKRKAQDIINLIECDISPNEVVRNLPIAQQQMVEIARALSFSAKIVIFDEPTSSLTDKEKASLFKNINKLKAQGIGIIYISHKLDEISEITDNLVVLRDGKNSGYFETKTTPMKTVVESMIGRTMTDYYHKCNAKPGEVLLNVENLSLEDKFQDVSFSVRKKEVVGLYGLVGAGRSEIIETIFGIRKKTSGKVYFEGKEIDISHSEEAIKHGIALVPENRKEQGLVLRHSCESNIALVKLKELRTNLKLINNKKIGNLYTEYKEKLKISSTNARQLVGCLSGGNQQKIVVSKWMCMHPKLLILDEPTRGIDVGAKAEIHKLIASLAEEGLAVIVISSEMPEIMGISNRIIAISQGKVVAEMKDEDITEKNLINAITG